MCGPLATFAIGSLKAIVDFQAASAESAAVREASMNAYENDSVQLSRRQMQEADATTQKLQLSNLEEAQKAAAVEVSAAESGIAGISLDNLLTDVARTGARNRMTEKENASMMVAQLQQEKKASQAQNQGRINSAPRPSPLALVAGIGGAAVDAANQAPKAML